MYSGSALRIVQCRLRSNARFLGSTSQKISETMVMVIMESSGLGCSKIFAYSLARILEERTKARFVPTRVVDRRRSGFSRRW